VDDVRIGLDADPLQPGRTYVIKFGRKRVLRLTVVG
jgi:hypothetical protein